MYEQYQLTNNIKAVFFNRLGGVSKQPYDSLNISLSVGDNKDDVLANRNIMAKHMGVVENRLFFLRQIHSANILKITEESLQSKTIYEADAMITREKNIALVIQTADCLPVLMADTAHNIVAAVHAGWRGSINHIVPKTLTQMQDMGSNIKDIEVIFGAAIHQPSYEVDKSFKEEFLSQTKDNEAYFCDAPSKDYYLFDLIKYNYDLCLNFGIAANNIISSKHDTYKEASKFFSYRHAYHKLKDKTEPVVTGRIASAIIIN